MTRQPPIAAKLPPMTRRSAAAQRDAGRGIACPQCGGEARVYNSRPDLLAQIRTVTRHRKCRSCGHRFTTHELPATVIEALETRLARLEQLQRLLRDM